MEATGLFSIYFWEQKMFLIEWKRTKIKFNIQRCIGSSSALEYK